MGDELILFLSSDRGLAKILLSKAQNIQKAGYIPPLQVKSWKLVNDSFSTR